MDMPMEVAACAARGQKPAGVLRSCLPDFCHPKVLRKRIVVKREAPTDWSVANRTYKGGRSLGIMLSSRSREQGTRVLTPRETRTAVAPAQASTATTSGRHLPMMAIPVEPREA